MQNLNFIKLKPTNSPRNKLFAHELKTFSNPERSRDRSHKKVASRGQEWNTLIATVTESYIPYIPRSALAIRN